MRGTVINPRDAPISRVYPKSKREEPNIDGTIDMPGWVYGPIDKLRDAWNSLTTSPRSGKKKNGDPEPVPKKMVYTKEGMSPVHTGYRMHGRKIDGRGYGADYGRLSRDLGGVPIMKVPYSVVEELVPGLDPEKYVGGIHMGNPPKNKIFIPETDNMGRPRSKEEMTASALHEGAHALGIDDERATQEKAIELAEMYGLEYGLEPVKKRLVEDLMGNPYYRN